MSGTIAADYEEPGQKQPLSESAASLSSVLAAMTTERRVEQPMVLRAFSQACPGTAGGTQARPVLAALLDELADHQLIELPRGREGWDTPTPPLPRWVRLPAHPKADGRPSRGRSQVMWRHELGWAASAVLTAAQFDVLKTVNRWLRDTDGDAEARTIIPMRERSLEIFGDEKRLDALTTSALFAPGRLTLATLFAERIPSPLAYERVGDGGTLLVIENSDTFETVSALLADEPGRTGYVAFGGGHAFESSVARITRLKGVTDIAYYGDLDDDGLIIPQRANATAAALGLPAVRPAAGLYRLLLQRDFRGTAPGAIDPLVAQRRTAWLPAELRDGAVDVLVTGQRLAQEATGRIALIRDASWRADL